ncbi:MAG: class I SAM-dependent methyltransferase [Nitrososphaerales archaeon]
MRTFLKQRSRAVRRVGQNRYEEGGAWFEPYLYIQLTKSRPEKHFSKIINENFANFYTHVSDLILTKFCNSKMCLDIGCATGTVAHRIAKHVDFIFGVDQSFSFVRKGGQVTRTNTEFIVANRQNCHFEMAHLILLFH